MQDKDGNEIDMRQNFDDEETGFDMRDVAGTENCRAGERTAQLITTSRTPMPVSMILLCWRTITPVPRLRLLLTK